MDLLERIVDKINATPNIPISVKKGYLGSGESFVIYPIPGSRVTQEFYDGDKDMALNYEIAMKSQNGELITDTLWTIQTELEALEALDSQDGSFTFDQLSITNKPYINQINDQGWLVFLLDITVHISIQT